MKYPMYMSNTRNIFLDSFKDRNTNEKYSLVVLSVHIYKIYGANN